MILKVKPELQRTALDKEKDVYLEVDVLKYLTTSQFDTVRFAYQNYDRVSFFSLENL